VTTHHAYVKKEAKQILAWVVKVAFNHAERHPELNRILALFSSVKEEMDLHMEKEELILFPRIKDLERIAMEADGTTALNINYLLSPITILEKEHDYAGSLLEEIRILSNDYIPPGDACTTYRLAFTALKSFEADLHQHVHLENNILFPKAITLLRSVKAPILN
jgi:regulator of cell morphogenesis and NO signaling